MKKVILCVGLMSLASGFAIADTQSPNMAQGKELCLLTGMPKPEYTYQEVRKVKAGKNSYGSVNDVIPLLVNQARNLGADAVINYNGSQRFGFWPWRFIRPVATGLAVKWDNPSSVDCEGMGGTYKTKLNGPLTTDA